jgi:CRP-like cAMP-binding protein
VRRIPNRTKIEALGRVPLFEGLSKRELGAVASVTDDLTVDAGTVLCRDGRLGREFFVVLDGTAEVTKNGERLATRGPGEFFGEIALIATTTRTATVTALTPLRCFVLTSQQFGGLLAQNPSVERKVLVALAERLLTYGTDPTLGAA